MRRFYLFVFSAFFSIQAWSESSLSLSAFDVRGDYGNERTTSMTYVPLQYTWRRNALKISVQTSFLEIDGVSGNNGGPLDTNGALPASGQAQGQGDSYLKLGYELPRFSPRVILRPQAKIKIPTANEDKGLGTGEFDYQTQLDSFFYVGGWWPYVSIGYRWRGDGRYETTTGGSTRHVNAEFDDGAVVGAGLHRHLSAATAFTVSYEHREPSRQTRAAVEELLVTVQYRLDTHWQTALSVGTGFTSASADQILGLQATYRF